MKPVTLKVLILLIAAFSAHVGTGYCQSAAVPAPLTTTQQTYSLEWLKELYEPGVSLQADTLVINKEAERLLNDSSYRKTLYPAIYTWEATALFIQKQEIKKALWYLINLYTTNDQNKEMVIKSILVYNKVFKMDKALMSSFYTYSLTDPEIGKIENGHSEITSPHIMEKKLSSLKALLYYLDKYKLANKTEDTK